jgi:hypothetical protein
MAAIKVVRSTSDMPGRYCKPTGRGRTFVRTARCVVRAGQDDVALWSSPLKELVHVAVVASTAALGPWWDGLAPRSGRSEHRGPSAPRTKALGAAFGVLEHCRTANTVVRRELQDQLNGGQGHLHWSQRCRYWNRLDAWFDRQPVTANRSP